MKNVKRPEDSKKAKCHKIWHEMVGLTLRRLPSESHASAWKFYENNLLAMRTMMYMLARNIFTLLAVVSENEIYDHTAKYLREDGGPARADLAHAVLPYAKFTLQALLVARAVLFIASWKWMNLTRIVFYLEIVIQVVEACMPINVADTGFFMVGKMQMGYINFWLSYFHWWPSLALSLFTLLPYSAARYYYYDDSATLLAIMMVFHIIFHAMNLLFIHLIITKVGMLYAETEVLRSGNDALLENLVEGVVIFDENDKEIIYNNLNSSVTERSGISSLTDFIGDRGIKPELAEMVKEKDTPSFAHIDKSIFDALNVDTKVTIRKLNAASKYRSIQEIVDKDESHRNTLFKVKTCLNTAYI